MGALPMALEDAGPDEREDFYDGLPQPVPSAIDAGPVGPAPAPTTGVGGDDALKSPSALTYLGALKAQRRQQQQAQRDAYDPAKATPIEGAPTLGIPAPPPKTSALGDFARQAWIATAQMGQGALSAASFATRQLSSDPDMVGYLEEQRAKLADYVTGQADKLSPAAKDAMHASLFGGKDDQGQDLPSPGDVGWGHYVGASVASMVPQVAMALLPGGLVGRVAGKLMGATAGAVAGTATTAASFGAQSAGDAYQAFTDAIDQAKPDELMKSPAYAELRNQGIDDVEARRELVRKIAPGFVAAHFGVGAAAGVGLGQFLGGGALGAAGRSVLARASIGAAEGAATMGGQGAAENALDQAAKQQAGVQNGFDPKETARAFASGALGGAVLGAGGGVIHSGGEQARAQRGRDQPIPSLPTEVHAPSAEAVAMDAALGDVEEQGAQAQATTPPPAPAPVTPPPVDPSATTPVVDAGQSPAAAAPAVGPEQAPAASTPLPASERGGEPVPPPSPQPVSQTTAEPAQDIAAQVQALADPANPKNAVFIAKGTPMPEVPADAGVKVVRRKEGVLLTTDPDKAKAFRTGPLDDAKIASLLDMAQTKQEVAQNTQQTGEPPQVVQAKDPTGSVVGEALATPAAAQMEAERLQAHAPGGTVEVTTPEAAQARRAEQAQTPEVEPVPRETTTPVVEAPTPTVPERVKSARQLQKEKMAAAGERQKGVVATAEASPDAPKAAQVSEGVLGPTGRPIEQVQEEARAAVNKALQQTKIVPIKDGQIGPAMTQARRELDKLIGGARTEQELHASLESWGTSNEGKLGEPLQFSKTRRRPVADAMMRLLTGEPLKSEIARGVMREDASRTGADAVGSKEAEATRAAGDENVQREQAVEHAVADARVDSEPSVGVQDYGPAIEKKRADTSNYRRRADDLLEKVTNGLATPHEAAIQFGAKLAGSAGRPREHTDFRAFLESELKHAEDPANETAILQKLAEAQNGKGLSRQAKAARTVKLQVALERTGAERAAQLRDIIRRLDDPVGAAAPKGDKAHTSKGESLVAEFQKLHDRYSAMAVGAPQRENLIKTVARDMRLLQDVLGGDVKRLSRADDKLDNGLKSYGLAWQDVGHPELKELGTRAADWIGDAAEAAYTHDYGSGPTPAGIAPQASRYVRVANDPRVNRDVRRVLEQTEITGRPATTHEILRSISTSSMVRAELRPLRELATRLLSRAPDLPVYTQEQAQARDLRYLEGSSGSYHSFEDHRPSHIVLNRAGDMPQVVAALHETLHSVTAAHLAASERVGGRDAQFMQALQREVQAQGMPIEGVRYAASNIHELHTMLMSEPAVQAWAASVTPSAEFRARAAELGYPAPQSKSVWRVFTDWVRRAVGLGPASASEHTLLDHVMRPLQDIVDRGAAHVQQAYERAMPDPVVRGYARPTFAATGGRLANVTDAIRERADVAGMPDKAMRAALPWATTDAIHDWNKALFEPSDRLVTQGNPLTRLRDAVASVASATKETYDKYGDRAAALVQRLRDPTLGPLMNDATIAGARLGDTDRWGQPVDNSHLKTPEQQTSLRELQGRFNRLSESSKETYRAVRDTYEEWHRVEREARLEAMTKLALPDATESQRESIAKALRTRRGTEAFLKTGDSDPIAKAFGAEWDANRELVKGVAKVHSLGFVKGDYFPLRRHGNYVVRYGEGENLGVEMFERRGEAEARRAELAQQGVDRLSQVLSKRESKLKDVIPSNLVSDRIYDRVKADPNLSGHAEELRNLLASTMLEYASRSEASRTSLARRGVKGASVDAARVFAQEFVGHGARMGHILHDPERNEALRQMNLVADDLGMHGGPGDQIRARAVINELEKRLSTGDDAQSTMAGVARKASTLGFVQSLMSPSHMLTSSIETHMNSASLLGARHGVVKSGLALSKALMDISPRLLAKGAQNTFKAGLQGLKANDWNLSHVARDKLIQAGANRGAMHALFKALDNAGLIDHSMEREMRRIANPGGLATTGVGTAWQRFMDLNAAGAHAVDVANKAAVAKAAFDLELRKTGGDQARAIAHAVDTVRKASPNYNLYNKPRMTTAAGPLGGFAAPIMQFKQYGLHMYSVMANLTRESVRGATPEAKSEARKALAGIMATHAVMAGALTLIADPLRYLGGAYDYATGATAPHDYQNDVRGFLADTFGPEVGELISRGLPHAFGIDIHRRVGLANLLEIPELKSFDKRGVQDMLATAMLGAAGQDAAEMAGGMAKLASGDLLGGFQALVPRALRDPMKAAALADRGVTDSRGKTILPSSKLSPLDIAAQAVGFQPARVSEFREGRAAVQETLQETKGERDRLTQSWLNANPTDRGAVMMHIREFNQAHPEQAITMAILMRGLTQRQQAQPGQFGLRVPPKAVHAVTQAGRFANVGN